MTFLKILSYLLYGKLNFKQFNTNNINNTAFFINLFKFKSIVLSNMVDSLFQFFCSWLIGGFFIYTYHIFILQHQYAMSDRVRRYLKVPKEQACLFLQKQSSTKQMIRQKTINKYSVPTYLAFNFIKQCEQKFIPTLYKYFEDLVIETLHVTYFRSENSKTQLNMIIIISHN